MAPGGSAIRCAVSVAATHSFPISLRVRVVRREESAIAFVPKSPGWSVVESLPAPQLKGAELRPPLERWFVHCDVSELRSDSVPAAVRFWAGSAASGPSHQQCSAEN